MNLANRIIELSRIIEESIDNSSKEVDIDENIIVSLYVFYKNEIMPNKQDLKQLESFGYIKNNKITKEGKDFIKTKEVKNLIKKLMS